MDQDKQLKDKLLQKQPKTAEMRRGILLPDNKLTN